ncbi:hypothetical protein F4782DRAFT_510636 [Xylaria castorea]|nr:hypothetical protein F4782DRAFT_510636 [Xylaria castorea]
MRAVKDARSPRSGVKAGNSIDRRRLVTRLLTHSLSNPGQRFLQACYSLVVESWWVDISRVSSRWMVKLPMAFGGRRPSCQVCTIVQWAVTTLLYLTDYLHTLHAYGMSCARTAWQKTFNHCPDSSSRYHDGGYILRSTVPSTMWSTMSSAGWVGRRCRY